MDALERAPSEKPLVIGLGYKFFSGKDTAARHLVETYGFVRLSFADALKRCVMAAFGWSEEEVFDDVLKNKVDPYWGISPAQACQAVGTPLFREALPTALPVLENLYSHWIRRVGKEVTLLREQNPSARIVFSDVRFTDEADYVVDALGGVVYAVDRDEEKRLAYAHRMGSVRDPQHRSETSLDGYNRFAGRLDNNASLADLYRQLDVFLLEHRSGEPAAVAA